MMRIGILIQTRACGSPPHSVYAESFIKFRETLTEDVSPPEDIPLICKSIDLAWSTILLNNDNPKLHIEKSLHDFKISLSDSAELNTSESEGGKYEAFRTLYREALLRDVFYVDLNTGDVLKEKVPEGIEHAGERVFFYLIRKYCEQGITDIMTVRASSVTEPGKVRIITISHIAHAILLHPMSHFTLNVLKLSPDDNSGIKAANHCWQFYRRLSHKNPRAGFIFTEKVSVLSSDLETATDYANPHTVRALLGTFLSTRCVGAPRFYSRICIKLLTSPRTVVTPNNDVFATKRGCLMGDPLTKTVMHLHHISASVLAHLYCQFNPSG
jgi:hypothetical protein